MITNSDKEFEYYKSDMINKYEMAEISFTSLIDDIASEARHVGWMECDEQWRNRAARIACRITSDCDDLMAPIKDEPDETQ